MRIVDILKRPWAIPEANFRSLIDVYGAHISGPKKEAALPWQKTPQERASFDMMDGVAVLDAEGPLMKKDDFWTWLIDGTSTETLGMQFMNAINSPNVKAVLLRIDSPGGTVDGTFELVDLIFANRGRKPVGAYTDGMMTSAAYAIGSAADSVFVSASGTSMVGSIGVIQTHMEFSKALDNMGVKVTHIQAGKYKTVGSPYKPLSDEDKKVMQSDVDYLYSLFVDSVARNRGVSSGKVLKDMADAQVFTGKQAVDAGLADGMATFIGLVSGLAGGSPASGISAVKTSFVAKGGSPEAAAEKEMEIMDLKELKEKHPELYAEAAAEGRAQADAEAQTKIDAAKAEGEETERARIQGVFDLSKDAKGNLRLGVLATVAPMLFDGKSTAGEAAIAIVKAGDDAQAQALAALGRDAAGLAVQPSADDAKAEAEAAAAAKAAEAKDFEAKRQAAIDAYRKEHPEASAKDALLGASAANPELFRNR